MKKDKLMALYELGIIGGGIKVENGDIIAFDAPAIKTETTTVEKKPEKKAPSEKPQEAVKKN